MKIITVLKQKNIVKGVIDMVNSMVSIAKGNEVLHIVQHQILNNKIDDHNTYKIVELEIKNVSTTTIGSALFEAEFFDIDGKTVDFIQHKIYEIQPSINYTIYIKPSNPENDKIAGYHIKIVNLIKAPESSAIGNEQVTIMKHSLPEEFGMRSMARQTGVDLAIRNITQMTIATVMFEVTFYDIEGNVIDKVKREVLELKPGVSRAVRIISAAPGSERGKIYNVKIIKTTTADIDKIQFKRTEINTTKTGEEEIFGIVKNISESKADAAIVAIFYNSETENIGTRVNIIRDLEPNMSRQFQFTFKPQKGEKVKTSALHIGYMDDN